MTKLQTIAYIATIIGGAATTITIIALIPTLYDIVFNTQTKNEVLEIIDTEADAVINKDLTGVLELYDEHAHIIDVNTNEVWNGKAQIYERYVNIFNNKTYIKLNHVNVMINIQGDIVIANLATDGLLKESNGNTNPIHGKENSERWIFKKVNDKWYIDSLTYNLP